MGKTQNCAHDHNDECAGNCSFQHKQPPILVILRAVVKQHSLLSYVLRYLGEYHQHLNDRSFCGIFHHIQNGLSVDLQRSGAVKLYGDLISGM